MSAYERRERMEMELAADERSPEEIELEIQRTRERMSSSIDALGNKLNPDHLKQQAKEAIAKKAHDVVATVGDQARQTGSRLLDFITENPLPVAAAGLGAIWLLLRGGSQDRAGELRRRTRRRARTAKDGLEGKTRDHTLAVAGAGAITGLALGRLLPETELERKMTGSTRGQLADRVEGTASRLEDAAIETGRELQETAKDGVA
jgi:hypothetical protein